jgi:2-polyprenyl-3-methyl-5-hydroxy-6-metoxy-1,4-benzoquinol methylase
LYCHDSGRLRYQRYITQNENLTELPNTDSDVPTRSGTPSSTLSWDPNAYYCDPRVATGYDRERFSSLAGSVYQWLERRALLRALSMVPRGSCVLDLPCGTGRLAEVLLDSGYGVVGADISASMLEIAQQRLQRFGHRFAMEIRDVRLASLENPKYSAVLCARVLMHFPLDEQIAFVRGVVSSSQRYVVLTHSLDSRYQRARRWVKRVLFGTSAPAGYPINNMQIRVLLHETGLREVRRIRLARLISEAIVIVAERVDVTNEAVPKNL